MTRARILALVSAAAALSGVVAAACSDSPSAPDAHNTVIDDTKPKPVPTTKPDDGGTFPVAVDASPYEAGTYGDKPDGYAPLALCKMCSCSSGDGKYCFGGGGNEQFGGTCDVDGGTGALVVGCDAIPMACAGKSAHDMCPCLLQQLPMLGCFPVCEVVGGDFAVYCPNP